MKRERVKIISGVSHVGGSTIILSNLTNLFNSKGIETTFYGPHEFHMDKCKAKKLKDLRFKKDDIILSHHLEFDFRPTVQRIVLASHEKWWFEIADIFQYWDMAVFNHEEQRNYHNRYQGPFVYIPNPKDVNCTLYPIDKPELDLVAGVIGSLEPRKQTHLSIQRALDDGCQKVLVFGKVMDQEYYRKYCRKYYFHPYVQFMGYSDNKQETYNSIGRVYHMSKGEVSCLVKDECEYTNTKFFGNEQTNHVVSKLTNDEIFELWKDVLKF
jgi:glycosyltransferase involved in cell wall biosynthesis